MEFGIFIALLLLGFFAGRHFEKSHYRSIEEREAQLAYISTVPSRNILPNVPITGVHLVSGACAISDDYFKMIVANLKSIVGGNLTTYESLVDRARREAVLRMKEEARKLGSKQIVNVRIQASTINGDRQSGGQRGVASVEAIAYGTALNV